MKNITTRLAVFLCTAAGAGVLSTAQAQQDTGKNYMERCLSGYVDTAVCKRTIANFWRHNDAMGRAALAAGLEGALIRAIAAVESGYNSSAVSPVGATGLVQIMPGTGRMLGVKNHGHLFDAETNLTAGAKYLRQMYYQFGDWRLAIAAYNAGPGAITKYGNQVPPYRETRNYVVQVLRFYNLFKQAEQYAQAQTYAQQLPATYIDHNENSQMLATGIE